MPRASIQSSADGISRSFYSLPLFSTQNPWKGFDYCQEYFFMRRWPDTFLSGLTSFHRFNKRHSWFVLLHWRGESSASVFLHESCFSLSKPHTGSQPPTRWCLNTLLSDWRFLNSPSSPGAFTLHRSVDMSALVVVVMITILFHFLWVRHYNTCWALWLHYQ